MILDILYDGLGYLMQEEGFHSSLRAFSYMLLLAAPKEYGASVYRGDNNEVQNKQTSCMHIYFHIYQLAEVA